MASTAWSFRPRRTSVNLLLVRLILLVLQQLSLSTYHLRYINTYCCQLAVSPTDSPGISTIHFQIMTLLPLLIVSENIAVLWKGRTAEERLKKDKNWVQLTPRHGNDDIQQGLDVCINTIMTSQFMLMLSNH